MDLKGNNLDLMEVNLGCQEFLEVEDLETLFSWRVSSVLQLIAGKVKAFEETRDKMDRKFLKIEIKNEKGEVVAKRPRSEDADEYSEQAQRLLDIGFEVKVPSLKMSEIVKMREEEGVPIKASSIHLCRKIIVLDVDLGDDAEPSINGDKPEEKPKGRAARSKKRAAKNRVGETV